MKLYYSFLPSIGCQLCGKELLTWCGHMTVGGFCLVYTPCRPAHSFSSCSYSSSCCCCCCVPEAATVHSQPRQSEREGAGVEVQPRLVNSTCTYSERFENASQSWIIVKIYLCFLFAASALDEGRKGRKRPPLKVETEVNWDTESQWNAVKTHPSKAINVDNTCVVSTASSKQGPSDQLVLIKSKKTRECLCFCNSNVFPQIQIRSQVLQQFCVFLWFFDIVNLDWFYAIGKKQRIFLSKQLFDPTSWPDSHYLSYIYGHIHGRHYPSYWCHRIKALEMTRARFP